MSSSPRIVAYLRREILPGCGMSLSTTIGPSPPGVGKLRFYRRRKRDIGGDNKCVKHWAALLSAAKAPMAATILNEGVIAEAVIVQSGDNCGVAGAFEPSKREERKPLSRRRRLSIGGALKLCQPRAMCVIQPVRRRENDDDAAFVRKK